MKELNASPGKLISIGYEGEDKVTKIVFRYDEDWLACGDGVFKIRVLRHGDTEAYNATEVIDDREGMTLTMTITDIELSVKGHGEMQVVYIGADFVKKSPVYRYNVSRAIDSEVVNPPQGSIINELVQNVGNLTELTTTNKDSLVDAINEVNAKEGGGGGSITVDDELSGASENPVQNKVIKARLDSIDGTVAGIGGRLATAETALEGKANTADVNTALSTKANTSDVNTALSAKANSSDVNSALSAKADKSYVDTEVGKAKVTVDSELSAVSTNPLQNKIVTLSFMNALDRLEQDESQISELQSDVGDVQTALAGKASTDVATQSANGLMSSADKAKLDNVGSVVTVSGTTPIITALSGVRYVCGEVSTLDITPCVSGICDILFTSGSTATVLTLPSTVKFPDGAFTPEANTTYEINILDGIYGVFAAWA